MNKHNEIPSAERWRVYESEKAAWTDAHPEATPREYEVAMQAIAKKCGV